MKYNGSDKWKQEATKKLNRIPENIIKDVKVNDESVVDEEGIANVAVPVYVSDLGDADQYVLKEALKDYYNKNETYSREEVNNLVDTIPKFAIEVVTTLPTTQISTTTIYLIKTSETETGNLYTEYIYVNGNWEILGIQKLDLTNYYTKQEVDELISGLRTETQEAVSNLNENIISHIGDSIKHITNTERTNWDLAKTHADSDHARTDATKVEKSTTNGNIKINGSETNVYTHPSGTNPHGTTKSDIGLGNVGNFKAVSTVASQGLTDTEKSNARANIGAGTSSFSGSYNDLSNKPTIGNGTVTIKQAGTSKGTFTMNQSGDTVIELTDSNTIYGVATSSTLGLVKSGTDITVDANGNVSVNDDSHNHSNYLPTSGGVLTGEVIAPSFKTTNSKVNIWDDNEGGNIRCDGEITSTYPNAFRAVYNNCGFFIRNDGVDTYFMFTNYGDPYGSWNSLRPMMINNASGNVMFGDRTVILHSNGQIYRNGLGSTWLHGRDYALIRAASIDGYSAFASIKTTNGSWEIGACDSDGYYDSLLFTCIADSDYNAPNNVPTAQIKFCSDGAVEGRARLIGSYTSNAYERFFYGGLEIRENNLVKNTQSDIGYAPSIGFHWANTCAGTLCLDKDAIFHFLKQDGTRATLDANLNGNASSASKLTTVRNIALSGYSNGSANFDGSGNISINDTGYSTTRYVTGDETSKPYWRIASITHNYDFQDSTMICIIDSGYSSGGSGIFKVQLRSDIISGAVAGRTYGDIEWLVRNGFSADQLILKINSPASNDNNYADLYFKATGTYNACTIKVISAGARGHIDPRIWLLYDGSEPTRADMDARTYTNQITGHDSGTVHSSQYANTSGTSTYANNVWTQSHNGDWYINSNWNGSYFVTNAKSTSGDILPIYVDNSGRADTLSGFTNTTTSATAVDNATQNGHIYVNDALGIVSQSDYVNDGACYVQAYSSTWVHQIYGDYRTGQIAVRGKNNGTWQSWRKVLDSLNYKSYCTPANIGAMGSVTANGYEGMAKRDGSTSDWIRTTYNGIIPYQEGVAGSGHSSLGTPSWYFSKAYIDNIYGYLNGNISGNAATATKLATARYIFGKSFNGTEDITGQAEVYGYYNSTVQSRFSSSGLKIRENGLVGSSQSDIGYAPSIGFFWNERIGSTLCLDKDGIFRFLKQEGTRATIDADVNGNINGYTWSPETPILHPSSSNTPFKILALDNTTVKYHTIPEYIVGSYNDSIFYKITNVLTFKDSNNALITGDKGNFIWAVSSWSDRKLKKNIKDANVSALDKINQIQFKEFDFIDDKKFGKHQELGYIADELKEVFPECVVTVPQDKEKFGYEELDQVQDVGLIKYLAKSIQELSSIINEQNKKINTLQKEVDKLKRKN